MASEVVGDLVILLPLLRASLLEADRVSAAPTARPLPPSGAALIALLTQLGPLRTRRIATELRLDPADVRALLTRLREDGVVVCAGGAWAVSKDWQRYFTDACNVQRSYIVRALNRMSSPARQGVVQSMRAMVAA